MIVTCEQCQARYKLDDSKIKGRGAKITCPRCKHLFVVYNPAVQENTLSMEPGTPAPPEPPRVPSPPPAAPVAAVSEKASRPKRTADDLNFKAVGISSWKVKVKIGLVYDFSDIKTLRRYIQDKRVTEDDVISFDGQDWVRIGDIPDLDSFFVRIFDEHEAKTRGTGPAKGRGAEGFEDGPTMIVGMGSLGANISTGIFTKQPSAAGTPSEGGQKARENAASSAAAQESGVFSDPFESLKSRQRANSSSRREEANSSTLSTNLSGRALATGGIFAVVVTALLAGAWILRPTVTPGVGNATQPGAQKSMTPADEAYREEMRRKLQSQLEQVSKDPEPNDDMDREPLAPLRPVIPGNARSDAASTMFSSSGGTSPSSEAPMAPSTANDHLAAGDSMYQQGDYRGAAAAYSKAMQIGGATPNLHYKLGETLYRAGSSTEAQQELVVAANNGVCGARKLLGNLLREQGDTPGAVGQYQEYMACNPSDRASVEAVIKTITGG